MTNVPSIKRTTFDEVMAPTYKPADVIPVRAEGSKVWDSSGTDYIDLAGGIAVTALGHGHPDLTATLTAQAHELWHVGNVFTNVPALRLARRLTSSTFATKVFFANSGAEANEAALKLARRATYNRHGPDTTKVQIVSFENSFHGRTLFSVSVGGQPKYSDGFGPLPAGIAHLPFNDIAAARKTISADTCAVIVEPIQGEGGIRPADSEFLSELRILCDKYDAALIFDEVQCGVGRTGHLYAYMAYGVIPDILTTAKALGNGFPIAAMLTTDKLAHNFSPGTHGSTYGGNPLGSSVADKVLELVNTPSVLNGVVQRHDYILAALRSINGRNGVFKELRGMGLLLGAELSEQFSGRASEFVDAALQHGVIMLNAGPNVLRFAPSLLIPFDDLEEAFSRFEAAIQSLVSVELA